MPQAEICPCCKRRIVAAKSSKQSPADKKLAQDIERAERAIGSLERVLANPASIEVHLRAYDFHLHTDESWKSESWDAALKDEAERLRRAIVTPRLLWSIYRRKDSGPSYVSSYDSMDTVRP